MSIKKIIQAALFVGISFLAHAVLAALPSTLRVATEATYPPFEFVDAKGEIQGFDVDIVQALCKQMQVTCVFSNQPWESLIPSLKVGKFDVLIGGMNITEARKEQVDFTEPYYASTVSFVAPIAKEIDIDSGLEGKTIGVQGGTATEILLKEKYPAATIKTYTSQQNAFLDLTSGRVDAVLADTPVVLIWLKKNHASEKYQRVGKPIIDLAHLGSGYGIALKKGNTELRSAFNKALVEIKETGEYEKIVQKYFSALE
jgi:arginine transport system substrate-binding protein